MDEEMRYDVFISYSKVDQKVAEGICGYLEKYDIRCFVAYRDILPGEDWTKVISMAILSSKLMVAVFSSAFDDSNQTDREITIASENAHIPILTYKLSNDEMTGTKLYLLGNRHWIDAFPNPEQYFGVLLNSVRRLLDISGSAMLPDISDSDVRWDELEHSRDDIFMSLKKDYDVNKPFLLAIEDVFEIPGRGTVVTGYINSGTIKADDNVMIVGYGKQLMTICTGIVMSRKIVEVAKAGDAVGLLLPGIDKKDVKKGQVVACPNSVSESKTMTCDCFFIEDSETPNGYKIRRDQLLDFWFRTVEISGQLALPKRVDYIKPNDLFPAKLFLCESVPLNKDLSFAIRKDGRTIGCGIVKAIL